MTTHRNTADYFAGIPQYAGRISPADLNAAKAAAWDEGHAHCFHVEDPNNKVKGNPYRKVS